MGGTWRSLGCLPAFFLIVSQSAPSGPTSVRRFALPTLPCSPLPSVIKTCIQTTCDSSDLQAAIDAVNALCASLPSLRLD